VCAGAYFTTLKKLIKWRSIAIASDELGHYNSDNYSIMLYGIDNKPEVIKDIRKRIGEHTSKFKLIVLDPTEKVTNVNILDIDL
jgi:hypothetical protein